MAEDVAISQIVTAVTTIFYAAVFAVGYYLLIKGNRATLDEMREQRLSGGRPQVIVEARYRHLPRVALVVRNSGGGAALAITFRFSSPIESSDGFVLSDLPYLRRGMDFLGPGEEIVCVWDHLDPLLDHLHRNGATAITVTATYRDLNNAHYADEWKIDPFLYAGIRHPPPTDTAALTAAIDRLAKGLDRSAGDP